MTVTDLPPDVTGALEMFQRASADLTRDPVRSGQNLSLTLLKCFVRFPVQYCSGGSTQQAKYDVYQLVWDHLHQYLVLFCFVCCLLFVWGYLIEEECCTAFSPLFLSCGRARVSTCT